MKTDIEVLTVINFSHHPFRFYEKILKIKFSVTDSEMTGAKAKRLVKELESKLRNFEEKWGTISVGLSSLDDFFVYQEHGKMIIGGWDSVHFQCHDSSKSDNTRRMNFEEAGSLIAKKISSWKFSHYKTTLVASTEPK